MVHVPVYIFTIISTADEGPDEITCFPAGLHFLQLSQQDCQKYHRNRCVFMQDFSEKGCLDLSGDISPYMRTFPKGQKGEFMDSVDQWGNTISPSGIILNCLPVSLTSHFSL